MRTVLHYSPDCPHLAAPLGLVRLAYQQARVTGNYRAALTALGRTRPKTEVARLLTDYFATLIKFDTKDRDVHIEVADEKLASIAQRLRELGEEAQAAEVTAKLANLWARLDDDGQKRGTYRILDRFFTFYDRTDVNRAVEAMATAQYAFPDITAAIWTLEQAAGELIDLDPCTQEDLLVNLALMHAAAGDSVVAQRILVTARLAMEGIEPFWDIAHTAFMDAQRWYGYMPPVIPLIPPR